MTKSELARQMVARLPDVPKDDVEQATKILLEQMSFALERGGRCEIRGFGTFSLHTRSPRIARNPKTGETLALAAKRVPHFKPGKLLKETINQGRAEYPIQG
ncbi:MAG: integration host factor subunit beta [Thiolinea sp.]